MRSRLDSLTPYNAFVTGFNDNGLVVLTTSSGVTQVARQTGNGELKAGQPIVWQTSGVPGVSGVCFDPAATPIVKPLVRKLEPEPQQYSGSKIWILYTYNGDLYVGGHQKTPELVQKSTTVLSFGIGATQIWGDGDGWEATYGVSTPVRSIATAVSKKKSKLVNASLLSTAAPYGLEYYLGRSLPSRLLGKGILQRYDIIESESVNPGDQFGNSYSFSSTWKSKVIDFNGSAIASGQGNHQANVTIIYRQGGSNDFYKTLNSSSQTTESYPAHYSQLGVNQSFTGYEFKERFVSDVNNQSRQANDFTLLRRDRKKTLVRRDSWSTVRSNLEYVSLSGFSTYSLLSNNGTSLDLFTMPKVIPTFGSGVSENSAGLGLNLFGTWHTFNYPVTTSLGPNDSMSLAKQHFGIKLKYGVNVHSIFKEASLIHGTTSDIVQVDAWGIPATATVLYTASWVSNASRFVTR